MSITFYFSPMSNASRIMLSLTELGVPFETVQLDLRAGDQRKPEFLAVNPNGKVPAVVIDGTPMFESVAIQIALGERYGVEKGLWPQLGTPAHLDALTWLVWGQVSLAGALFSYMMNTNDWFPKERHNTAQAEHYLKESQDLLRLLDARLEDRDYITGERCTLVDIDLASVLGWALQSTKIDTSDLKHLPGWLARISRRPSFVSMHQQHTAS
ncbi:MAG: glutathione S-transferase family protein [Nannocystis sp.]|nr:glutathione S-transferase family protein [Nannocystis sp.]MBA3550453.1 glutathione S-transferase family protein [Nannocystis sp.]